MTVQKIIFRADGNHSIGLGHVSRCLALAELLSPSNRICFAVQDPDKNLLDLIKGVTNDIITLPKSHHSSPVFPRELDGHLTGKEIIVLDGYHFDAEYEAQLRRNARAVVTVDDIPSRHFFADVIFNFCGGIQPHEYSKEAYSQLFLGPSYLFLRAPFLQAPPQKRLNNKLLLNMGGADPGNHTYAVLKQLISLPFDGDIEVVIGSNYKNRESLEPIVHANHSITLRQGLNTAQMYEAMNQCSIAVLPPSTVALEFLSTGGIVFLYQTAANQTRMKQYLLDQDVAVDFNQLTALNISDSLFQDYLKRQANIFDGLSIQRVQKVFNGLTLGSQVSMAKAGMNDIEQCFAWANEAETRQNSYSTDPIPWEEHVRWFEGKMNDPKCHYFIASIERRKIGQIRFDLTTEQDTYQVSYLLDKNFRGKGLSPFLLTKGIQLLRQLTTPKTIVGFVQKKNVSSVKAFYRAGFNSSTSSEYIDSLKFQLSFT